MQCSLITLRPPMMYWASGRRCMHAGLCGCQQGIGMLATKNSGNSGHFFEPVSSGVAMGDRRSLYTSHWPWRSAVACPCIYRSAYMCCSWGSVAFTTLFPVGLEALCSCSKLLPASAGVALLTPKEDLHHEYPRENRNRFCPAERQC